MNLESSATQIEIDFNQHTHTYSKNVSMIFFPTDIAKIERAMMYVEVNGYKHPVINNNHFTLPIKLRHIIEKEKCKPQKIKLLISSYGIKTKVHKRSSLGFGATLIIFRYRNFVKTTEVQTVLSPFRQRKEVSLCIQ